MWWLPQREGNRQWEQDEHTFQETYPTNKFTMKTVKVKVPKSVLNFVWLTAASSAVVFISMTLLVKLLKSM